MKRLTEQQRRQRLVNMLQQVAPKSGIKGLQEQLQADIGAGFEGTRLTAQADEDALAAESLDMLQQQGIESLDGARGASLEAIIHRRYRPALFIENDSYKRGPSPWNTRLEGGVRQRIEQAIPSIGRINLPNHPTLPYAGTGFVVGEGLLMTNRHVAELFAQGLGTRVTFRPGQGAEIDFKQEQGSEQEIVVTIDGLVMVHPYWDMALLRVSGLSETQAQLMLDTTETDVLTAGDDERYVVTVGYPAQDRRNNFQDQMRIFERFDVKRLQPGVLRQRRLYPSFGREVPTVTHDCSTLGGNSGSAVVDIVTGNVVGLHFAGEYLEANFAVPVFELARDQRVVDAGVNFSGSLPPSDIYPAIWRIAESGEGTSSSGLGGQQQPVDRQAGDGGRRGGGSQLGVGPQGGPQGEDSGAMQWTIPIQVKISLGAPQLTPSGGATAGMAGGLAQLGAPSVEATQAVFSRSSLHGSGFSWSAALSTVLASQLAYSEPLIVCGTARNNWGFSSCEFIDVERTQCFVASDADVVLVSFRGTQQVNDWLTNLSIAGEIVPQLGRLHSGFLAAFRVVESRVKQAIGEAARRVVLTGHSLGGALATIAAAMWADHEGSLEVYTFGQPAVGSGDFLPFMRTHFPTRFYRFVNDDDIVPRLPPTYQHVGELFHFDPRGNLQGRQESVAPTTEMFTEQQFDLLQQQLQSPTTEGLFPSFSDHELANYISKISKHLPS